MTVSITKLSACTQVDLSPASLVPKAMIMTRFTDDYLNSAWNSGYEIIIHILHERYSPQLAASKFIDIGTIFI